MRAIAAFLAAALATLAAQAANAQEFRRLEAEDEPRGARLGAFMFAPAIEARTTFDDNIFREETGAKESVIATFAPSFTLSSDWRRHSVKLEGGAIFGAFLSSRADDFLDAGLKFEGVLDATRAARIRFRLGAERGHETRGGDDAPTTLAGPIEFTRLEGDLTGQYAPGRLRVQPFLRVSRTDFGDEALTGGGVADQDDRDRSVFGLGALVGYRYSPKTELFAEVSYDIADFDERADRNGFNRDNEKASALIGAKFEVGRLIDGEIAVGYERRTYDDDDLDGFGGLIAEAAAAWRPSRLIEIQAKLRRRTEETTIASASTVDAASAEVAAIWGVRRFVDLKADIFFERRDFEGAARNDDTLAFGLGVEWRFRRGAALFGGVRHVRERSDAPGEDHTSNQIQLGARYRF